MNDKHTEEIKLWGIVQGVGFRPFVAKTAEKHDMKGTVLNVGGLVEITVTDTTEKIDGFLQAIQDEKPGPSEIVHIRRTVTEYRSFDDFEIISSGSGDDEAAMIPADLAICPHCLEELYDENNPRYMHPFISCMICGPRYTIIDRIPYDRDNTTMEDFPMCGFCESQYGDLHDRRHHAQTISCHDCGPQLLFRSFPPSEANPVTDEEILDRAASLLRSGNIIAFKSVGGYNLVADPFNGEAVRKLRSLKNRPSKPFAVMFRSTDEIRKYCSLNEVEESLLNSSARPIILLEHRIPEIKDRSEHEGKDFSDLERSRFIGSFLPSFGAQYMLLDRISPLIFTSANFSDMPMIKDDEEIDSLASVTDTDGCTPLLSGVVYNRRRIQVRVDDSVTRVIDGQPQMIRRSKGYAPVPLYLNAGTNLGKKGILATGGQLKNSFSLSKGPFTYMSQYFGDMDTEENRAIYGENVERMKALFRIEPELAVCDMHPLYNTRDFAERYASEHDIPLLMVQHHHAHAASVMAENNLTGKVLGVCFDGTGYGTDGCIWGGEFLLCEKGDMKRMAHLAYVDMIGGDSSMKDARKSALSYIHAVSEGYPSAGSEDDSEALRIDISDIIDYGRERLCGDPKAPLIMSALKQGINTVRSSSMGRLFDGVSALLGIKDYNDYEGQCAIMLEDAAAFAKAHPGERPAADLALSFHERIADLILEECLKSRELEGVNQIALTGGTFQNRLLMEGVLDRLRREGFDAYYNISVSPNDGGIALGQAFLGMHNI